MDKTRIQYLGEFSKKTILEIAASIENHSTHPFAKAIISYASNGDIYPLDIENFKKTFDEGENYEE